MIVRTSLTEMKGNIEVQKRRVREVLIKVQELVGNIILLRIILHLVQTMRSRKEARGIERKGIRRDGMKKTLWMACLVCILQ